MRLTDIEVIWNMMIGTLIKVEGRVLCLIKALNCYCLYVTHIKSFSTNTMKSDRQHKYPWGQLRLEIMCLWAFVDICMLKKSKYFTKMRSCSKYQTSVYLLSCFSRNDHRTWCCISVRARRSTDLKQLRLSPFCPRHSVSQVYTLTHTHTWSSSWLSHKQPTAMFIIYHF